MARNIDYSKWDRMKFSDSESDSSDDEKETGPCRVTRLDQPGRVTILPDGQVNVEETSSSASASAATSIPSSSAAPIAAALPPSSTPTTKTAITDTTTSSKDASQETPTHAPKPPASWTSRGGFVEASNLYWSQDRYTVTLRFQLPVSAATSTKPKAKLDAGVLPWDCHVTGILPYNQRHAAVQSLTTDLSATLVITDNTNGSEYFRDHVAYPIHAAQDDDDDDDNNLTDWSIETWPADSPNKYLIVTLSKATPVPNMTIWWRRPVRSCPEIELTTDHQNTSTSTFAAAWEQAHAEFRQGRQEQTRVEVDVGSDDDEGDEV
jgi:hypothetical protein